MYNISDLGEMVIHWIQEEATIVDVRKLMEKDDFILNTINDLKPGEKSKAERKGIYKNKNYVCLVIPYITQDPLEPKFKVGIVKDNGSHEWEAVGDVYTKLISETLKEG